MVCGVTFHWVADGRPGGPVSRNAVHCRNQPLEQVIVESPFTDYGALSTVAAFMRIGA
jgi:hypothetical protein